MKFIVGLLSVIVLSYLVLSLGSFAGISLPWWSIVVISGLVGWVIGEKGWKSFLYGFLAIVLLWGVSAWMIDKGNEGILVGRLGELFGGLSGSLLILITAVVGGLMGGMGALSGSLGSQMLKRRR